MAGKKESSALWRQASIVIRADILEQARQQKIDISEAVNRALAERLGIDYRQQKIPEGVIAEPVIIASNEAPALPDHVPAKPGAPASAAIINADDPLAAKTIKTRQLVKEKPAPKGSGTSSCAGSCSGKSGPTVHSIVSSTRKSKKACTEEKER